MWSGVKGKPTTISGEEVDAIHARKWYNWNSGTIKWIKRQMNKRFRKQGKKELNEYI